MMAYEDQWLLGYHAVHAPDGGQWSASCYSCFTPRQSIHEAQ